MKQGIRLIQKLSIEEFIQELVGATIIDVRSPSEYQHARIPGAISLPLFTDEERKVVGTLYKQRSREEAIKAGLDFFGPKMRKMVETAEEIYQRNKQPLLVHCWRGGMRSAAVAWLLNLYGLPVKTLAGGYKAYRRWALEQFERPYPFYVVGGYTGSGKTDTLAALAKQGRVVIDLEALAQHKGSSFGGFGLTQPSPEMFENLLALALFRALALTANEGPIWVEDESQRIGLVNIPGSLWECMRSAPVFFLDIPFDLRLNYITDGYGRHTTEELINAIIRIKKRLGGLECNKAITHLINGETKECFRVLLTYYDKQYIKGLHNRKNLDELLVKINCTEHNAAINAYQLLVAAMEKEKGAQ
ncbi:MAG: tRNA 2-selenouridine(34) synthase MnmH [Chitinophagia bacterium]|nr:tRNA 2-selenouridine(34) synthase MnmH [Chitinophagia bacterium]